MRIWLGFLKRLMVNADIVESNLPLQIMEAEMPVEDGKLIIAIQGQEAGRITVGIYGLSVGFVTLTKVISQATIMIEILSPGHLEVKW